MGQRKIKRRSPAASGRPSVFFIIALILGLVLLVFMFKELAGHAVVAR